MQMMGSKWIVASGLLAFYAIVLFALALIFYYFPLHFVVGTFVLLVSISAAYFTYKSIIGAKGMQYCHTELEVVFHKVEFMNDVIRSVVSLVLLALACFQVAMHGGFNQGTMDAVIAVFQIVMLVVLPVTCLFRFVCYRTVKKRPFRSYRGSFIISGITWALILAYVHNLYVPGLVHAGDIERIFIVLAAGVLVYGMAGLVFYLLKHSIGVRKGHTQYVFYILIGVLGLVFGLLMVTADALSFECAAFFYVLLGILLSFLDSKVMLL